MQYGITPSQWAQMSAEEQRRFVEANGIRICASTFVDDETITYGFGRLDIHGEWEYPVYWKRGVRT